MKTIFLDADRRIGGPYTMGAALLAHLVPPALERRPDLVTRHDIEIRAVAPGLHGSVPARRRSLADSLPREQRVLVPGARRTLRLANGLAEFVRDHLTDAGPLTVTVANLDEADPTDTELLAVLRRRVDPALLVIEEGPSAPGRGPFAADFDRYRDEGFHHAMAEAGLEALRGRAYEDDPEAWERLLLRVAASLEAIEREEEARELYDRVRRRSTHPRYRATAAYATAMILVRHHDHAKRDPEEALAWVNEAITITSLMPDRRERAFHLGFDLNGKALVEVRRGRYAAAMELVERAIELAETDLAGEHPIHRLVLYANRGQLLAMAGRKEEALADYTRAVEADPGYPDYYLDRGNLLQELGRTEEALADYEAVMRLSPPFPEAYYNRSEIRYAAGDLEGARADLDHTLELDPEFARAYVNRAGLHVAAGDLAAARRDAERGLALTPGDPHLLCVLGQVELAEHRHAEALAAFDRALEADPDLAAAWAGRGELAYERGDHDTALAALSRALKLEETPELLFNRSLVHRAAGRPVEARQDLLRAAQLAPDDADVERALSEL
ncbi:Tetratricopeptide repeat-containing protein [Nonomuraea maritima]|uniref:Tetratricopeptide repeat-containing protein n=1 Tax=Nonomuraea maritima TaxID=683260 RepID=A0A1G8VBV7_9ACTN|nr:tetratricopeptide repeat protein [Nonomuraea maritima]SDJ63602.1 Tetratricopeptide repeat-containing protein [Nonomuraea maritima]